MYGSLRLTNILNNNWINDWMIKKWQQTKIMW